VLNREIKLEIRKAFMTQIKLVVGLGNPGLQYARNRHNIGFMVLEEVARRLNASWQAKPKLELAEARFGTGKVWLLKPQTFMNLSGEAVGPFARFHKLEPHEILVVSDDLDLPFGRLRFRLGGSSGGQNGVKDIHAKIGSDQFVRLKVGISRPPEQWTVVNWVLSNFAPEEAVMLEQIIKVGADAVLAATRDGFRASQNAFNSTDLRPKPPVPENPVLEKPETEQAESNQPRAEPEA
jgi:peptidyl-tRNA hydrolase, PTH1 family